VKVPVLSAEKKKSGIYEKKETSEFNGGVSLSGVLRGGRKNNFHGHCSGGGEMGGHCYGGKGVVIFVGWVIFIGKRGELCHW